MIIVQAPSLTRKYKVALKSLALYKHSSLFCLFDSDFEKKFIKLDPQSLSWIICPWQDLLAKSNICEQGWWCVKGSLLNFKQPEQTCLRQTVYPGNTKGEVSLYS
jgi:hypothetical protein